MILRELFPTTADSRVQVTDMLVFCSLIETVIQFFYIKAFHDNLVKMEAFDEYLDSIWRELPLTSDPETLGCLRYLGVILQSFSLFVLEPVQAGPEGCQSYGFAPLTIREGDVMIPVWCPKSDPEHSEVDERAMNFMTMFILRCEMDTETCVMKGRVVDPAVC